MKTYWDLTPGQRDDVDSDPAVAAALNDATVAAALAAAIDAAAIDAHDAARTEATARLFGKEN